MLKQIIYDRLGKDLRGDFLIIKDPDHPYLISPPDILLAAPGQLLAIFIPKKNEGSSSYKLISRLIAVRLALPETATCILLQPNDSQITSHWIENSFDDVLEVSEFWKYCSTFVGKGITKRWEPIPNELRLRHFLRSGILFQESEKLFKHGKVSEDVELCFTRLVRQFQYKRVKIPSFEQKVSASKTFYKHRYHNLSQAKLENPRGRRTKLLHRSLLSLGLTHAVNNGIPYIHEHGYSLVLIDELPLSKYDELKFVRSTAFCGLTLTFPDKVETIHKRALSIGHRLERRHVL